MKPITFAGSGMLAGLSTMLELMGYDTTDQCIAHDMEAPYLFVKTENEYLAGAGLYRPQWLNLYLHPRGFHMSTTNLEQASLPAYLRQQNTALLRMRIEQGVVHPVVFSGYGNGRYQFINIKSLSSDEPDVFSLSVASLKRRLEECVTVYTLQTIPPEPVDYVPLLNDSLNHLTRYQEELLAVRQREISQLDFQNLQRPLFRALMQDFLPMAALSGDDLLYENLRKLNHHYKHIFTHNSGETVWLVERLPKKLILQCIEWLREDIRDRLYELSDMTQ